MIRHRKRKIITSKIKKGCLIKYPLEKIKRESFDVIKKELKQVLRKQPGIYALYHGERLVYVGMASELYGRVHGHSVSKRKWDNFSLFVIKNIKYLRDIETAVVRIAKPEGNKMEGRMRPENEHYLRKLLKNKVKEKKRTLQKAKDRKNKELSLLTRDIRSLENGISA